MGSIEALFAMFITGYLLGVWTACGVVRQGQRDYEDGTRQPRSRLDDPTPAEAQQ